MASLAEHLTHRFYEWEVRGRGWFTYDEPIQPEPPFVPFHGHFADGLGSVTDDGREHTFTSSLVHRLASLFHPRTITEEDDDGEIEEAISLDERGKLSRLSVVLPAGTTYPKDVSEQFLLNLSQCRQPICLEFVGTPGSVTVHMVVDESESGQTITLLQNHFPDAIVTPDKDRLASAWNLDAETMIVEFGLSDEFMLPLRTYRSFSPDPLIGIISTLGSLGEKELACVQVIFQPVKHPWAASIRRAAAAPDGGSFFADSPDFMRQTSVKLASPLYGAVIRACGQSTRGDRSREIVRNLAGALAVADNPQGNRLIPLHNDLYESEQQEVSTLLRNSHRSGMLLSLDELVTLVHLPGASVVTPTLVRSALKTKPAPSTATEGNLVLGENVHAGKNVTVGQTTEQRVRHTYVIGASGSGKSTLLAGMIKQDIEQGAGVGVLDPHGDLIDQVLTYVPPERFDDVVLLDLADEEHPVPFNILSAHSELEKNLLASDLAAAFQRLSTSWGDQMTAVLSNAILAFLESERGGTLADLRRFLVEKRFRAEYLPTVRDQEVQYYWNHEFPLLSGKPQGSVVTRLNTFLRPKPIRHMVAHGDNRIDVGEIMNSGKIFLGRIPQGAIGEENAYLLGTLLVSAFHRSALCRQSTQADQRRPFFLYIDEFHNFVTPSMAQILSGARKYGLGLILAHQELRQLESRDPDVASAVMVNPGTRVCFRLGDHDAKRLESGFSGFDARDLQNLSVGQAVCRMERNDWDFNLAVPMPPKVDEVEAKRRQDEIRSRSRSRYTVLRREVEAMLAREHDVIAEPPKPVPKPEPPKKPPPEPVAEEEPPTEPPPPIQPREASPAEPPEPTPGRGGMKHKAVQRLIKHWAEGMGFRAQVEKTILNGRGAVDVALYKGETSIACEISVTTPTDHECRNLAKCVAADFTHVAMICDDEAHLSKIKQKSEKVIEPDVFERVHFMTPQALFQFIEAMETEAAESGATTIRGYRVNIRRSSLDADSRAARLKSVKRTIAKAATRRKKKT